jgi:ribosomal protein S18 acetylase RimI-like enzyme
VGAPRVVGHNPGMKTLLDNIMWNCLSGPQARFATGSGTVRRYAPGFSPIIGCQDPRHPDFTALAQFCEPGDSLYIDIWSGPVPDGWRIDREARMWKMVWEAPMPPVDVAPDATPLQPAHSSQAVELARLTNPGPFGVRTLELGEYFGYFEGDRLIAMAGERMEVDDLREISGICTHPEFQGRGLARKLTLKLVHRQMRRGLTPYLHVMSHNPARTLYEKMGFRNYLETLVRVITRL